MEPFDKKEVLRGMTPREIAQELHERAEALHVAANALDPSFEGGRTQPGLVIQHEQSKELQDALEEALFKLREAEGERENLRRTVEVLLDDKAKLMGRLGALGRERDELQQELERRAVHEMGAPSRQHDEPEPNKRGPEQAFTEEELRDYIAQNLRGRKFPVGVIAAHFGVAPVTARRRLTGLVKKGTVKVSGSGAGTRYQFVKPDGQSPKGDRVESLV